MHSPGGTTHTHSHQITYDQKGQNHVLLAYSKPKKTLIRPVSETLKITISTHKAQCYFCTKTETAML